MYKHFLILVYLVLYNSHGKAQPPSGLDRTSAWGINPRDLVLLQSEQKETLREHTGALKRSQ